MLLASCVNVIKLNFEKSILCVKLLQTPELRMMITRVVDLQNTNRF